MMTLIARRKPKALRFGKPKALRSPRRRYASQELDRLTFLYRGSGHLSPRLPADVAFFALHPDVAENYAHAHRNFLRKNVVHQPRVQVFKLSLIFPHAKLFVMTVPNLAKLVRDNPENAALARAVRGVTGVTAAGPIHGEKFRNWNADNEAVLRTPAPNIRWLSPNALHVHTGGWLSPNNQKGDVYASKRLALEMRRVLGPLGYDGWTYHDGHFRYTGKAFHSEVMLWDAPSKVHFVMDMPATTATKTKSLKKNLSLSTHRL
jgi:hypothetical protein